MPTITYLDRRKELKTYFDRTAVEAWSRLTSDAPVSGIRATVRAGRDRMRATLLDWLPADLTGLRILDAGCGTGALAVEAARRGAHVVATDLSPTLISLARQRTPSDLAGGTIEFRVGDLLEHRLGTFDHVVAMDSLIHYRTHDTVGALAMLASRARSSIVFTFAPRTPALTLMHMVGRCLPRGDRAPAIEPAAEHALRDALAHAPGMPGWRVARTQRVASGFYISQAMELVHG